MFQGVLPDYDQLPTLTSPQIIELVKNKRKIIYYDELVLDVTEFRHPGSHQVFNQLPGSIVQRFQAQRHSYNAKLMLCHLAIGKIGSRKSEGYIFMDQMAHSQKVNKHSKIVEKLDFSKSLVKQVSSLDPVEKEIFTSIPKYYNYDKIMFTESKFTQYFYRDRFWLSQSLFVGVVLGLLIYLLLEGALLNSFLKIFCFLFGVIKWTVLEYYFHRIVLHDDFSKIQHLNGHYIHHAFPGFKDKLALSPTKIFSYEIFFYFFYSWVLGLGHYETLHLILGVQLLLAFYDGLHYYYHHGPDLNISYIRKMRRNHLKHHFRDQNRGFGVTTSFWDWVFGTLHVK